MGDGGLEGVATDVVSRPYDWQVVACRAVRLVDARETQAKLRFATSALERLHLNARTGIAARRAPDATDALTGLPNGERLRELLQETVSGAADSDAEVGIAILGIDRFDTVNDKVGVNSANRILQEFAERFRECLNDKQVIGSARGGISAPAASLGGARFAILIADSGPDEIDRFWQMLQLRLQRAFRVDGHCLYLKAVIGTAMAPATDASPDGLLHQAEMALIEHGEPQQDAPVVKATTGEATPPDA